MINSKVLNRESFVDYFMILKRNKKKIAFLVLISVLSAAVISLFMPDKYKSYILIMPVESASGGGKMGKLLSSAGMGSGSMALLGMFGGSSGGSVGRMDVILNSRTVAEKVVQDLDLMPKLFPSKWDNKRNAWKSTDPKKIPSILGAAGKLKKKYVRIDTNKREDTIRIEAFFNDPQTAADIANAYTDALQWFIAEHALTASKRNRIYVGQELQNHKKAMLNAGKKLKELYGEDRVSMVGSDIDVFIGQTPDNLHDMKAKMEILNGDKREISDILQEEQLSLIEDVPQQVYLTSLMMEGELLGKMSALLATQYEMAKVSEKKDDLAFEVIDKAIPPPGKYSPKPLFMCTAAFLISLLLAMYVFVFLEYKKSSDVSAS
jgi:uncharacterized protein involved in exopolysaccharide biosynthesis